jgi:hypothetical protein
MLLTLNTLYWWITLGTTLPSVLFPGLISLFAAWRVVRHRITLPVRWTFLLALLATIECLSAYEGRTGGHILNASLLLFAPLALWYRPLRFSWDIAVLVTFVPELIADVWCSYAYQFTSWETSFAGVGGAGWHDGLFLDPATSALAVLLLSLFAVLAENLRWINLVKGTVPANS